MRKRSKVRIARCFIQEAFNRYLDYIVDEMVRQGIGHAVALTVVFETADCLYKEGRLPRFPDNDEAWCEKGEWLVRAVDCSFMDYVHEVVG